MIRIWDQSSVGEEGFSVEITPRYQREKNILRRKDGLAVGRGDVRILKKVWQKCREKI